MKKVNWSTILVKGTEWFARLAVLNLLWLLFSLPLFTIIPATYALFAILKLWNDGEELDQLIFSLFKNQFIFSFKRSYHLGLPFIVIGLILIINLLFFFTASSSSAWFFVFKMATIFLAFIYIFLFCYSFALSAFREERVRKTIWTAFLIMFSQPVHTLMIALSILLSTLIFDLFPALLFFFSISIIALLFLKVTNKGYKKLIQKAKTN